LPAAADAVHGPLQRRGQRLGGRPRVLQQVKGHALCALGSDARKGAQGLDQGGKGR